MLAMALVVFMLFAGVQAAVAQEQVERLRKAIEATTDRAEQARLHKELGDYFTAESKPNEAADEYLKALSLARERFSLEERRTMAARLSWAGRFKESIAELRDVLAADPGDLGARIDLARILSWAGETSAAVEEADRVLAASPGNRDALLVQANALRWGGNPTASIPIYRKLLEEKEEFDARLGLASALLSIGDIKGAREAGERLTPEQPYQEKDLQNFRETQRAATRPDLDIRYSHYSDTPDDNVVNTYTVLSNFWIGNWRLTASYRHTDAEAPRRDARAEDLSVRGFRQLTERIRIRAGVGVTQLDDGTISHVPTGQVGAEARVLKGTIGAGVSREALTDIAPIIQNEIKTIDGQVFASQQLTDRLSVYGEAHYRHYSDDNHAVDVQATTSFAVYRGIPTVSIGYRFRFLDFDHQSTGGYFDPQNYVAHQGVLSVSLSLKQFYGSAEGFGGHQRFRDPTPDSGSFFGGGGTVGFRPTSNLSFEVNGFTSSAAGPATGGPGFKFFTVGARLLYTF